MAQQRIGVTVGLFENVWEAGGGTASVPIVRAALAGALVRCGRWLVLAPRVSALYTGWGAASTKDGFSCGKKNSIRRPQNRTKKDIMELILKLFY